MLYVLHRILELSLMPDSRVSTPRTKHTPDTIDTVPLYGLSRMKEVIGQAFPELAEIGFADSKVSRSEDAL
jgi:sarcosine oxidase / L-pipecolate oxidase